MSLLALLGMLAVARSQDGGQVIQGGATITSPTSTTTRIDQSTDRVIINWNGFSIDAGSQVIFAQPGSTSVALNRVTGGNPSSILGTLSANGNVFLLNPNGIVFGAGSQINVNGLVASTLSLSDSDFISGNYHFVQDAASPLSYVSNQGTINAGSFAALVAPLVENGGTISAPGGSVYLLGTTEAVLNVGATGLIGYSIGSISGGNVNLAPGALSDVVRAVVNTSGIIEAGSVVENADGSVTLTGAGGLAVNSGTVTASGGTVSVHGAQAAVVFGTLDVSAVEAGQLGGTVHVLGGRVGLDDAIVNASGAAGGGTVLIGGDYLGQGVVPNATSTVVTSDSVIYADALDSGNGGRVIVWSDLNTRFYGGIFARGGPNGGDGGFVETSGHYLEVLGGRVDASSPLGAAGTWLLDPVNVTVDNFASTSGGSFAGGIFTPDGSISPAQVDVDDIIAALNGGTSVTITTTGFFPGDFGDITVLASIVRSTATGLPTLTLDADRDITVAVGADIAGLLSTHDLNVVLDAGGDINLNAQIVSQGGNVTLLAGGAITTAVGGTVNAGGGAVLLTSGGAMTLNGDVATNVAAGSIGIVTGGTLTMIGDLLSGSGGVSVDVNGGADMNMAVTSGVLTRAGAITLNAEGNMTLVGVDSTSGGLFPGGASITAIAQGGVLTVNSTLISGGGSMTLQADEIDIVGSASGSGTLTMLPFTAGINIEIGGGGGTGALDLQAAEIAAVDALFSLIVIGSPTAGNVTIVGPVTFDDPTTIRAGTGGGTISQTALGAIILGTNNLTLLGDEITLAAAITGSGIITFQPSTVGNAVEVGGGGATAALDLTAAELAFVANGFAQITIGGVATGNISVPAAGGGLTVSDPTSFQALVPGSDITIADALLVADDGRYSLTANDAITVTSAGSVTSGALALNMNGASITINGQASSTGAVNLSTTSGNIVTDDDAAADILAGTLTLTTIGAGTIGSFGDGLEVDVATLNASTAGGTIDIQHLGAGLLTLNSVTSAGGNIEVTSAAGLALNSSAVNAGLGDVQLIAVGDITGQPSNAVGEVVGDAITLISSGGSVGTVVFIEIDGTTLSTSAVAAGGILIYDVAGGILVDSASTAGGGITIVSLGDIVIDDGATAITTGAGAGGVGLTAFLGSVVGGAVDGTANIVTGFLSIDAGSSGTGSIGTGINELEINATTASFTSIGVIRVLDLAGGLTVSSAVSNGGAISIRLPVGSGSLTVSGPITSGAGAILLEADDMAFTGAVNSISGSSTLTIQPGSVLTPIDLGTSVTVGALTLTDADLLRLADGFTTINIGRAGGDHDFLIDSALFRDALVIRDNGAPAAGVVLIQDTGGVAGYGLSTAPGGVTASIQILGDGSTTTLSADIVTAGAPITISDAVIIDGVITLDTTNGGGVAAGANITINLPGTIDANLFTTDELTLNAGTAGAVSIGTVGGSNPMGTLTIIAGGLTTLNGNITTDEFPTSGNVNLSGATGGILLNGDITITSDFSGFGSGGDVSFGSVISPSVAGANGLTIISGDGAVTLVGAGSAGSPLEFLTIGSAFTPTTSVVTLSGNYFTDNSIGTGAFDLNFATGTIVLPVDVLIDTVNGGTGGAVDLSGSSVIGNAGSSGLTIQAGAGTVQLTTAGVGANYLEFLSVTTSGALNLEGNLLTDLGPGTGDITLTAGQITLVNSIVINSDFSLGGIGLGGNITLTGAVDATTDGVETLTILAGSGDVTLPAAGIGTSVRPGTVAVTGGSPVNLLGDILTEGGDVTFTGSTSIVLGASITIDTNITNGVGSAGLVSFGTSPLSGSAAGFDLTIDTSGDGAGNGGNVTLASFGSAGGAFLNDVSLSTNGAVDGAIALNGASILLDDDGLGDAASFVVLADSGPVTLGTSVTIDTEQGGNGAGGDVNVGGSPIGAAAAGVQTLTINASGTLGNGGDVTLQAVGSPLHLGALTVLTDGQLNLNGNISTGDNVTTGDVNFGGATGGIVITVDLTITSNADGGGTGGDVNLFGSDLDGVGAWTDTLTIIAGDGLVDLPNIGETTALGAVTVTTTGVTTLHGNISTDNQAGESGNIDFSLASGGIVLAVDVFLNSDDTFGGSGGNITLTAVNGSLAGDQSLTIQAGNNAPFIGSGGDVVLASVGGAVALESLTIETDGQVTLGGSISTADNIGSGNVDLSLAVGGILLTANVTIDTNADGGPSGGDVDLNGSTVRAAVAADQGLVITAGDGNVDLPTIGVPTALEFLTVTTSGVVTLNGDVKTDLGPGTGNIDFSGATGGIVLNVDLTITANADGAGAAGDIDLSGSAINGVGAGNQSLVIDVDSLILPAAGVGSTVALEFLDVNATGMVFLNGDITTDQTSGSGNIDFAQALGGIRLNADVVLDSDANNDSVGGDVDLNGSAISTLSFASQGLTVTAGDGNVDLPAMGVLDFVFVTTTGGLTLNGNVVTDEDSGSGAIDFSGVGGGIVITTSLTINSDGSLGGFGGYIDLGASGLNGTAVGAQSLTLIGNDPPFGLGGNVTVGPLGQLVALGAVSISSDATVTLNGSIQTDSGNVTFIGPSDVVLGASVTIDTNVDAVGPANAGNVDFGTTNVSANAALFDLIVDASTDNGNGGTIAFSTAGAVGGFFVDDLTLTSTAPGVDGAIALSGNILLDGVLGDAGNFSVTAGSGPVTISASITIDTEQGGDGAGGDVNFGTSDVDGAGLGLQSLTIDATGLATGGIVVLNDVGSTTYLSGLTVSSNGQVRLNGDILTGDNLGAAFGDVDFSGATGEIVLNADLTINSNADGGAGTGGDVDLSGSTVRAFTQGIGVQGLTVLAGAGAVTLGQIGTNDGGGFLGRPLDYLVVTTTGTLSLGGNISTDPNPGDGNGQVALTASAIVLTSDVLIDTDESNGAIGGAVTLAGTVNGTGSGDETLAIQAGNGVVTLPGNIGGLVALGGLSVATTSSLTLNGNITTDDGTDNGNVNFSLATGGVVLAAPVVIDTDAGNNLSGGDVNFGNVAVNAFAPGAQGLTISAGDGLVTLGPVGQVTYLDFLSVSTTGGARLNGSISADGPINFSGTSGGIVLGNSITLNSDPTAAAGATIDLTGSAVNALTQGVESLTLTAGAGSVVLGAIGTGNDPSALTITTAGNVNFNGSVTVTGAVTQTTGTGTTTFTAGTLVTALGLDVSNAAIQVDGDITTTGVGLPGLLRLEAIEDISVDTNDIVVTAFADLISTNGDIYLCAGDDILINQASLPPGPTFSANGGLGTITLEAGCNDLDGFGSLIIGSPVTFTGNLVLIALDFDLCDLNLGPAANVSITGGIVRLSGVNTAGSWTITALEDNFANPDNDILIAGSLIAVTGGITLRAGDDIIIDPEQISGLVTPGALGPMPCPPEIGGVLQAATNLVLSGGADFSNPDFDGIGSVQQFSGTISANAGVGSLSLFSVSGSSLGVNGASVLQVGNLHALNMSNPIIAGVVSGDIRIENTGALALVNGSVFYLGMPAVRNDAPGGIVDISATGDLQAVATQVLADGSISLAALGAGNSLLISGGTLVDSAAAGVTLSGVTSVSIQDSDLDAAGLIDISSLGTISIDTLGAFSSQIQGGDIQIAATSTLSVGAPGATTQITATDGDVDLAGSTVSLLGTSVSAADLTPDTAGNIVVTAGAGGAGLLLANLDADQDITVTAGVGGIQVDGSDLETGFAGTLPGDITLNSTGTVTLDDALGPVSLNALEGAVVVQSTVAVSIDGATIDAADTSTLGAPSFDVTLSAGTTLNVSNTDVTSDEDILATAAAGNVTIDGLLTAGGSSFDAANLVTITAPAGAVDIGAAGTGAPFTTTIASGGNILIEGRDQVVLNEVQILSDENLSIQETLGAGLALGIQIHSSALSTGQNGSVGSSDPLVVTADGSVTIDDPSATGSSLLADDGDLLISSISGAVDIDDSQLTATTPFNFTDAGTVTVAGQTGVDLADSSIDADEHVSITSAAGPISLNNSPVDAGLNGNILGNITITATVGAISILNGSDLTANEGFVSIDSNGSTVTVTNSGIFAVDNGGLGGVYTVSIQGQTAVTLTGVTIEADASVTVESVTAGVSIIGTTIDAAFNNNEEGDISVTAAQAISISGNSALTANEGFILVDSATSTVTITSSNLSAFDTSGGTGTTFDVTINAQGTVTVELGSNVTADEDVRIDSAGGNIVLGTAGNLSSISSGDDIILTAQDDIALDANLNSSDSAWFEADTDVDGDGGIVQGTGSIIIATGLVVSGSQDILIGTLAGSLAVPNLQIAVNNTANAGVLVYIIDDVDLDLEYLNDLVGLGYSVGAFGYSVTHPQTADATGRVHVETRITIPNLDITVNAPVDPFDFLMLATGDVNIVASVTATNARIEADTDVDGAGGIVQFAGTFSSTNLSMIASTHGFGAPFGIWMTTVFVDNLEAHIRPLVPAPGTGILVQGFDPGVMTLTDLGDIPGPGGSGDIGPIGYSITNPVGNADLRAISGVVDGASMVVGGTLLGGNVDVGGDLFLTTQAGLSIQDDIVDGSLALTQTIYISSDADLSGFGPTVQADGTFIFGEQISVWAGGNGAVGGTGIQLGVPGGLPTVLFVPVAEFEITAASPDATSILVYSYVSLQLVDLNSNLDAVFNPVGPADIRTVGGFGTGGQIIVQDRIRVEEDLHLASRDEVDNTAAGNAGTWDSIYVNADILTDLGGGDTFDSTVEIWSGDNVEIALAADITAEQRIHIRAGNNGMSTMAAPGPFPNDIDNVGRIFQAAGVGGTIQTTVNTPGSGDIVLEAQSSIEIHRLTARRLQAANADRDPVSGEGYLIVEAQGDLELNDIDGLGFAVRNSAGVFPFGPFDNLSVILNGSANDDLLVFADVFAAGSVSLADGDNAGGGAFMLVDACITAIAGTISLNGVAYPGPANGANSVFFLSTPCLITYGPASYVLIAADNNPATDLDLVLTPLDSFSGPARIVLIAEGSVILDGAVFQSPFGIIAIGDWQYSDPNNSGGIYVFNGGLLRSNDFQFQIGGADTTLEIGYLHPAYPGGNAAYTGVFPGFPAGLNVDLDTQSYNPAVPSSFQIEVLTQTPGGFVLPYPLPSTIQIDHQGSAILTTGGILASAGSTLAVVNPLGGFLFDALQHPLAPALQSDVTINGDVVTSRDQVITATGSLVINDVNLEASASLEDPVFGITRITLVADADGNGLGLVDQNVDLFAITPSGITADELVVYAADGITLPNTFVGAFQGINSVGGALPPVATASGHVFIHNTGDLVLADLDLGNGQSIINAAAGGDVTVIAESDITVAADVVSVDDVVLSAEGAPGSSIFLNASVTTTGGATSIIDLFARDSIVDDGDQTTLLSTDGRVILTAELGAIGDGGLAGTTTAGYIDVDLGGAADLEASAAGNVYVQEVGTGSSLSTSQLLNFSSSGNGARLGLSVLDGQLIVDTVLSVGNRRLILTAEGISGNGTVIAGQLVISSTDDVTLATQVQELQVTVNDPAGTANATIANTGNVTLRNVTGGALAVDVDGAFTLTANSDITVAGPVVAGSIDLSASGSIAVTLAGRLEANVSSVSLTTLSGNISIAADSTLDEAVQAVTDVTLVSGLDVFVSDADATAGGFATIAAGGDLAIAAARHVNLLGQFAAADVDVQALGNMTVQGSVTATTGRLELMAVGSFASGADFHGETGVNIEGLLSVGLYEGSLGTENVTSGIGASVDVISSGSIIVAQPIVSGGGVDIDALGAVTIDDPVTATGASLVVAAGGDVFLGGLLTAVGQTVTVSAGGRINDGNLALNNVAAAGAVLTAASGIGSASDPLETAVDSLTSSGGGAQFLAEADGLTQINLNGGTVVLTAGAITDVDGGVDLTATSATVTAASFGTLANPIQTAVDALTVDTSASNGDQFISEANALGALNLTAGGGSVTLTAAGAISDADASVDVAAATATLSGTSVSLGTAVTDLNVTSTAGDIVIDELDGLSNLNLNAGTGSVTLTAGGTIADGDGATDITALAATLTAVAIGSGASPIQTDLSQLTATATGLPAVLGSIFIEEASSLTAVNLTAGGIGVIDLTAGGFITDNDGDVDFSGATLVIDAAFVGTTANPIQTSVSSLSITANTGDIIVTETDGLTALNLDAADDIVLVAGGAITAFGGGTDLIGDTATITAPSINVDTDLNTLIATATAGDVIIDEVDDLTVTISATGTADIDLASGFLDGSIAAVTAILDGPDGIDVQTTVDLLFVDSANGDIDVFNLGALVLSGASALNGSINIGASGALVVDGAVTADLDVELGSGGPLSIVDATVNAGGNLSIDSLSSVSMDTVTLLAGGGLTLISGGSASLSGVTVTVTGAFNATVQGDLDLSGTVTAGTVDLDAFGDLILLGSVLSTSGDVEFFATGLYGSGADITSAGNLVIEGVLGVVLHDGAPGNNLTTGAGFNVDISSDGDVLVALPVVSGGNVVIDALGTVTIDDPVDAGAGFDATVSAGLDLLLFGAISGTTVDLEAVAGSILDGNGAGVLNVSATSLVASAGGDITLDVAVSTFLDVAAPSGTVVLRSAAALTDADGLTDVTAQAVVLVAAGAIDLDTSVDSLTATAGTTVTIDEASGLSQVDLSGTTVTLTAAGSISDTDAAVDVAAGTATISGTSVTLGTAVTDLNVTSTAGNIVITELDGLSGLNLNAGAGNVTLAANGTITDGDGAAVDVVAFALTVTADVFGTAGAPIDTDISELTVTLTGPFGNISVSEASSLTAVDLQAGATGTITVVTGGFITDNDADVDFAAETVNLTTDFLGTAARPIQTSAGVLLVNTSGANGSQFIVETDNLTGLNLNAGTGNVTLTAGGAIVDTVGGTDILAATATITAASFGTAASAIDTTVTNLAVNTSAANGDQFIDEADGLSSISLNAGAGSVTLAAGGSILDTDAQIDITSSSTVLTSSGAIGAFGDPIQLATGALSATSNGDLVLSNQGDLLLNGASADGNLELQVAGDLTVGGDLDASGSLSLYSSGDLAVLAVNIDAGGTLTLSAAGAVSVDGAVLDADGASLDINGASIVLDGTTAFVDQDASLTASGALSLVNGTWIESDGNITVSAGTLTITDSLLNSDGQTGFADVTLSSAGALTIGNSTVSTPSAGIGNLILAAGGTVAVDGSTLTAGDDIDVLSGGNVVLTGTSVNSGDDVELHAGGSLAMANSTVSATDNIDLFVAAGASISDGSLTSGDDVTLTAGGDSSLSNLFLSAPDQISLDVQGGLALLDVDVDGGDLTLTAAGALTATGGTWDLDGGSLTADVGSLALDGTTVWADGTVSVTSDGAASFLNAQVDGDNGVDVTAGGSVTVVGSDLSSDADLSILSGGDIFLTGGSDLDVQNRVTLTAAGSIQMTTGNLSAIQLVLSAGTGIDVTVADVDELQATNAVSGALIVYNVGDLTLVDLTTLGWSVRNAGGSVTIETGVSGSSLFVDDPIESYGAVTLEAELDIVIDADITGTILRFEADSDGNGDGEIDQTSGTITGDSLVAWAAEGITLTDLGVNVLQATNTEDGDIDITATGDLQLADLDATGFAVDSADDIFITVLNGSLIQTGGRLRGDGLTVSAATGIFLPATEVNDLSATTSTTGDIFVSNIGDLTVVAVTTADGDILLRTTLGGDMDVDFISAPGHTITLESAGHVEQTTVPDGVANLVAPWIFVTAQGPIGDATALEIDADEASFRVTGAGDINVLDTTGSLYLAEAVTAAGNVRAETTGAGHLFLGLVQATGTAALISLNSIFDGNDLNGEAMNVVTGGDAVLIATTGVIGTLADCIEVQIGGNLFAVAGGVLNGVSISICGTTGGGSPIIIVVPGGGLATANGLEFLPLLQSARAALNDLLDIRRRYDPILQHVLGDSTIWPPEMVDDQRPQDAPKVPAAPADKKE